MKFPPVFFPESVGLDERAAAVLVEVGVAEVPAGVQDSGEKEKKKHRAKLVSQGAQKEKKERKALNYPQTVETISSSCESKQCNVFLVIRCAAPVP